MTKLRHFFLVLLALVARGWAFAPVGTRIAVTSKLSLFSQRPEYENQPLVQMVQSENQRGWIGSRLASRCAGLISGLCGFVARGMAEDLEYAELPPPYVPALFGVVLLAGIGVLTASLGDVMTEGKEGLSCVSRTRVEAVSHICIVFVRQRQTWDSNPERAPRRKSNEAGRHTSSVGKYSL